MFEFEVEGAVPAADEVVDFIGDGLWVHLSDDVGALAVGEGDEEGGGFDGFGVAFIEAELADILYFLLFFEKLPVALVLLISFFLTVGKGIMFLQIFDVLYNFFSFLFDFLIDLFDIIMIILIL